MEFIIILVIAAVIFGLCFLVDKLFTRTFRGQPQHRSSLSVRLSKRYGSIGVILAVLGVVAIFVGVDDGWLLTAGGAVLIVGGCALAVYYMSFGVFYDEDGFVLTTFGKRSGTYRYADIQTQQLYMVSGGVVVELHLTDGRTVQLQSTMDGMYPFMDYAFEAWLRQTGRTREACSFYDPQNSCWFPPFGG